MATVSPPPANPPAPASGSNTKRAYTTNTEVANKLDDVANKLDGLSNQGAEYVNISQSMCLFLYYPKCVLAFSSSFE